MQSNFTLFVSFVWLTLSSDDDKTMLINLRIGVFHFTFFPFTPKPSQNEWTKLNQLASKKHEKLVDINILQETREPIHVIKQLDIYLTSHTRENNTVNHVKGNFVCKNKCKCLAFI